MKSLTAVSLILIAQPVLAKAAKLRAESHTFHIHGEVEYRCYAGYDAAGHAKADIFDSKTHQPCDNQSYKKIIVDKSIKVKIEVEPSPDDNSDLSGSWDEKYQFKGHEFDASISLFKSASGSSKPYMVRITAGDDEPVARKTAIVAEFDSVDRMNRLKADYSSAGTKEEIGYVLTVEPEKAK